MSDEHLQAAEALLTHRLSGKRRSGAKRLRKLGDRRSGPALLRALERELRDRRTWETQYEMVMALGECGYVDALPLLRELASRHFDATMVYVAVGDAIVRLSAPIDPRATVVMDLVNTGNLDLADGALRAMAMLRIVPSRHVVQQLVAYAQGFPVDERARANRRFWVVAAAPGWLDSCPSVRLLLESCVGSDNSALSEAAAKALKGQYARWKPA